MLREILILFTLVIQIVVEHVVNYCKLNVLTDERNDKPNLFNKNVYITCFN